MTPQGHFTVIAPVAAGNEQTLRAELEKMSRVPGIADPDNEVLSFGSYPTLHFARLVILDDPTLSDIEIYGVKPTPKPTYLAFMGDCDGAAHEILADMVRQAAPGLRQLFRNCADFDPSTDLLQWMISHDRPTAASYVNWLGRTVQQIKEESALQRALSFQVSLPPVTADMTARARHRELAAFIENEVCAGRVHLTPPAPTPIGWRLRRLAYLVAIPFIAILLLPLLMVLSPLIILQLRILETSDPEICPRPSLNSLQALQRLEDVDVTNQYTAIGSLKPGWFRQALVSALIVLVDYIAQNFFARGYLARVRTIHFARWVFLDHKARMLFASSYDGVHEAYMDDFINKVAWGLNLVFSNGVGWPRTDWLITRGARREHQFKYFQRRHQIPTQVWYKAYPGLTLMDLERNHRIRRGLQATSPSESEAVAWLNLL